MKRAVLITLVLVALAGATLAAAAGRGGDTGPTTLGGIQAP